MTHTGDWLGKGWQMATKREHFWPFVLIALIFNVVMFVAGLTYVGSLILCGPAMAGIYAVILHLMKTGKLEHNRVEKGFQAFLPAMLAGILSGLFTAIGMVFCLVPGIILAALYLFPLLLIVDRKMEFWQAMEESRKKVQENLLGFMGFVLAIIGINLLGLLACGVGVLVSGPVVWCATAAAYRELWPEEETTIIPSAETTD
jgi:uncharacterized membrane protein